MAGCAVKADDIKAEAIKQKTRALFIFIQSLSILVEQRCDDNYESSVATLGQSLSKVYDKNIGEMQHCATWPLAPSLGRD